MRKRAERGILILGVLFILSFLIIAGNYLRIATNPEFAEAAVQSGEYRIEAESARGTIYDRNMNPLVNRNSEFTAAVIPQAVEKNKVMSYAEDKAEFAEKFSMGQPFLFRSTSYIDESEGLTVFRIPVRYSENQIAQHLIGYTSQGEGVSGIEAAYDKILRSCETENSVTYSADGFGRVLAGDGKVTEKSGVPSAGVVTTIDSEIQRICESAGADIRCGAISVADIKTGDITALASFPDYSVYSLEDALSDEDSPMINRNLYSYSVGSVFKLVTACQALKEDYAGYKYDCGGSVNVNGQQFLCHDLDGHGIQSLKDAVVNSCNTYFISLSQLLKVGELRKTAFTLGFGREIHLCSGMTASAGVLPTEEELSISAELANFSFGQGRLTASPLQVLQMTCAIANGGKMPVLRVIKGITTDGVSVENEKEPRFAYTMEEKIAEQLGGMMKAAVEENENSKARSAEVSTAAKTSTAQTGRFREDGEEICNAWITGYFPADSPKYAVTVLVEDGGFGNDSAAPVFRKIAEEIVKYEKRK